MAIPFRIGTASKLTGISIDTLRAWERRYGAVVPERGETHEEPDKRNDARRNYTQTDIDRLILLRRAVESGHTISSVARLPNEEIKALLTQKQLPHENNFSLIEPLLRSLEDFDYPGLHEKLSRLAALLPPGEIVNHVVLPVMSIVGRRWHDGELGAAQEHMMSALLHNLLGTLMGLYRPAPNASKLIFTTLEGEPHVLGILSAAMLAAGAGLSPVYLGASLPEKEIVYAARRSNAKAVVLQITEVNSKTVDSVRILREALPDPVELWWGGNSGVTLEFHAGNVIELEDFAALDRHYSRLLAAA